MTKRVLRSTSVAIALHALAEEQVAFPVAGHGPVVGFGGPFADVERAAELALAVHDRVAARAGASCARERR